MSLKLELPDPLKYRRQWTFFDDFLAEDVKVGDGSTDIIRWTITADAGGAQGLDVDGVGGIYAITTDGDDNDEAYIESREFIKFAADKPLIFEARIQYTEANTDDANVIVGVMDAPAANALVDNGGGITIPNEGFAFYKVDGGTVWNFQSEMATVATSSQSETTAGGSSYQTLRCEVDSVTPGTTGDIVLTPYVDGARLIDSTSKKPIQHRVALSAPTEMAIVLGAKAGGANAETLLVDYVCVTQLR